MPTHPLLDVQHGSRGAYQAGCRCCPCRAANARYEQQRARERAKCMAGVVDATPARRHLRRLQRRGIGKRQVARLTGLSLATVRAIRSGRARWVRPETVLSVLQVHPCLAPGQVVPSGATRRLIRALLVEGIDRTSVAACAGSVHHPGVRVRTAARVLRLYRLVTRQ
jgi:hypothetical protein